MRQQSSGPKGRLIKAKGNWLAPLSVAVLAVVMLVVVGCGDDSSEATATPAATATPVATATPLPTPTPTATNTPVPSPTLSSPDGPAADFSGVADPEQVAQVSHLLRLIPADFTTVAFADVQVIEQYPEIQAALGLEDLGLPGIVSDSASNLVEEALFGAKSDSEPIIAVSGPIDLADLFSAGSGLGGPFSVNPEQEAYREHEIWSIEALGLSVAAGSADETTVTFAIGSLGEGGLSANESVKNSLDVFDNLAPAFLTDENMAPLLENLPSGFAISLQRDCQEMDQTLTVDLSGCNGVGVSSEVISGNLIAANILLSFDTEEQAAQVSGEVAESDDFTLGDYRPDDVASQQVGNMAWIRAVGNVTEIYRAVSGMALQ